uniref:MADF domain-containing protein n=1 Tax=Anopheles dirus TaxID=7168 RepID=A0A182N3Y2_9DIPT
MEQEKPYYAIFAGLCASSASLFGKLTANSDRLLKFAGLSHVKARPCLFDSSSPEYKQTALQDKAWASVSELVGEGVDTCKKRWRNLRCCMTRYLKSVRDNNELASNARRKPYYLYHHMQFVLPHLKMRDEISTFEQEDTSWIKAGESEVMVKDDLPDAADEDDDDEDDEEADDDRPEIETVSVPVQETSSQQIKDSIMQSIKILPIAPESHTAQPSQTQHHTALSPPSESLSATTTTFEIITAPPAKQARLSQTSVGSASPASTSQMQTSSIDGKRDALAQRQYFTITGTQMQSPGSAHSMVNDADHNFFQSLVPDIQTMTMDQKRKFKIGILQLIDAGETIAQALCVLIMILLNGCVWRFFVKALQAGSGSTLRASLASAATNYVASAILGTLLFNEQSTLLWWLGTAFVLAGLLLIIGGSEDTGPPSNEPPTRAHEKRE